MNAVLASALYGGFLGTAWWSASMRTGDRVPGRRRPPIGTIGGLVVVGVPSVLQLIAVPELLAHLQRDRAAIGAGQWWRLVTSLIVQDGGWPGTVFNLVFLLLIGTVAEREWGLGRWLGIALASGIGAQLWGLAVQPSGAGNSVVNFGLAASVAVLAVRSAPRVARVLAGINLLLALLLLVLGDIHGGAAAIGAGAGLFLGRGRERPIA